MSRLDFATFFRFCAFSALSAVLVLVFAAVPQEARAGFIGHTINMTEYTALVPPGPPISSTNFGNRIVGPGIEPFSPTQWTVDISDSQILLTNNSGFMFDFSTSEPFFGDAFFDILSTVDPIVGVTLLGTNIAGMNAAHVSSDADHVYLNFANLPIPGFGSFVNVGVQFVPEPASVTLAAIAFAGLAARGWRRKR